MTTSPQRIPWKLILSIGVVPALTAVLQLGRIHPDEVYQWLEPAFYRARGYGVLSWEWSAGIRNWAIPIAFAGLLKLSDAVGITDPRLYRAVLEVPQYLLHVAMLAAVFRYGERRVGRAGAAWATALVGLSAPVIVFAGRTTGESFSAAFLVISLAALEEPESTPRTLLAGAGLGAAVVARYASAVPVAAALGYLLACRRWRQLGLAALGAAMVGAGLGALDWLTWGRPFHSVVGYVQFNLLSGDAARYFGVAPGWYFLPVLARALPLWAWVGLSFAIVKQGRRVIRRSLVPPLPVFCAICTLIALSAVAHKEERFIYPVLVLLGMAAAPGAVEAARIALPRLRAWIPAAALATNALGFAFPGELRAQRGDQFRAIVRATRPPDASGLLIVNEGVWGAGGFFYIGKRIPWLTCDWPADPNFRLAMADHRFNRAVTYEGRALAELEASGFQIAGQIDEASILVRR